MIQIHQIQPKYRINKKNRIGRGGKRGGYSGRGIKGQKARAGRKIWPQLREIIKKIPKKRGYRTKRFREKPVVVNLKNIGRHFKAGEEVNPKTLIKKGIIRSRKRKIPAVKILGAGSLNKKLDFQNFSFSKSAAEKIKKQI